MNAAGLILCAFLVGQVKAPTPSGADPRCGGVCLYVALKSLDLAPSSYAELEGGLGRPTTAGYSMQQLEDYAKGRGATTLAVETSLANLRVRERPFACIALVEPAHFLLISEVDDRLVHLIDPPNQATVPLDTFNATWSRKALLLSRSPFLAEATLAARGQGRRWFGWLAATAGPRDTGGTRRGSPPSPRGDGRVLARLERGQLWVQLGAERTYRIGPTTGTPEY